MAEMAKEKVDQITAAYALNLWTVSISQIIDYNDVNVLEQEYNTIMNNLNLENMPDDEALLDVIKEIMDEITFLRISEGDKKIIEKTYQHQLKMPCGAPFPMSVRFLPHRTLLQWASLSQRRSALGT